MKINELAAAVAALAAQNALIMEKLSAGAPAASVASPLPQLVNPLANPMLAQAEALKPAKVAKAPKPPLPLTAEVRTISPRPGGKVFPAYRSLVIHNGVDGWGYRELRVSQRYLDCILAWHKAGGRIA